MVEATPIRVHLFWFPAATPGIPVLNLAPVQAVA